MAKNVQGGDLEACSLDPKTGFFRDGCCHTSKEDTGMHTVCAVMTEDFLVYGRSMGNDLITPRPEYRFKGLKPGDRWCVCALRWKEAYADGCAPPVILESTHQRALDFVPLAWLQLKRQPVRYLVAVTGIGFVVAGRLDGCNGQLDCGIGLCVDSAELARIFECLI
jgi:uncharacterized protein (DUF2237 family)